MKRTLVLENDDEFFSLRESLEARDAVLADRQSKNLGDWTAITDERRHIMRILDRLEKTLMTG